MSQYQQFELDHLAITRAGAPESMVLLASDGSFPLTAPGTIAAYGAGVRHTIKGGTGSGDVNSRHVVNIEEGLRSAGFTLTTEDWLDAYDRLAAQHHTEFVARLKAEAKAAGIPPIFYGMGAVELAGEYDLPLDMEADAAIYVLSRDSGEGSDRKPVAGDVLLTESEIRDITALDKAYKHFMLVLNVGGVVDLSPVKHVRNILLLSQLGAVIGDAFADVLLGRSYPSGHLSTTWAAWGDYPSIGTFGDPNDTEYREGIYVGYRYFDSAGPQAPEPLFSFGHGLSYTSFSLEFGEIIADAGAIVAPVTVTNTGGRPGKEVVQAYVSVPSGALDQPFQALAAFAKTRELAPGEAQTLTLRWDMADLASFDESRHATVLEAGGYLLRLGTSSRATRPAALITLSETAIVRQVHDALGQAGFVDWKPEEPTAVEIPEGLPELTVQAADLRREDSHEPVDLSEALDFVSGLSDEELSYLVLGQYGDGADAQSVIGQACEDLVGAAGQTCTRIPGLEASLIMPDGPAGLRLAREVGVDKDGRFPIGGAFEGLFGELMEDAESMRALGVNPDVPERVPESTFEQYTTAIPIGTAVAQSWNVDLARTYGDLVGAEMDHFGAHLWLAPAFNLHRSILCGRNFEYMSEDPILAGRIAAGITQGVQSHPGRGVTVKHFAFNNQETNRFNSSSHVSQRAARELYLRSFEIVVRTAQPHGLMTSYNLVNNVHTSERADLLETILRDEWGYEGLVMTDWVVEGMKSTQMPHPAAYAAATVKAGNELFMPGCEADREDILAALRGDAQASATLTREELEKQAARVVRMVWKLTTAAQES